MSEKLVIKNFGPIKHVELEIKRFNILIGEQATGKSTIAKVLAVCRYFSYIVADDNKFSSINSFEEGLRAWGLYEYIQENSFISYNSEHYSFQTERTFLSEEELHEFNNKLEGTWKRSGRWLYFKSQLEPKSDKFVKLWKEYYKLKEQERDIFGQSAQRWQPPTSFFSNDVKAVMDNPAYSPTERGLQSIFSLGKDFSSNITDSLFKYFAKNDEAMRFFRDQTEIKPLKIYYSYNDFRPEIKKITDKDFIGLSSAASGYQAALPFILAIKYYYEYRNRKKTFIIEEPEQNLFPTTQYEMVKFFAEYLKYHNAFLLTTHSPYILTSLNNLMYAYQIGKEHKEEVKEIIEEKYWVNPDNVSAYILRYNEKEKGIVQEKIIDNDGLIKTRKIDEISSFLNEQFDKLMNIELGIK
jgi:predicted ATP-dependent endonuclease of OLD family